MAEVIQQKTRYFYIATFFFVLYLSFLLLKPFILAILTSFVVAYLIYPVYKRLNMIIKNRSLCSAVLLFLLFLVVLLPSLFIAEEVIKQGSSLYHDVVQIDLSRITSLIRNYVGVDLNLELYLRDVASKMITLLLGNISEFALSLPSKFVVVFVSLFVVYYLLKEGDKITYDIKKYLPLREKQKEEIVEKIKGVTSAVVYGVLVTAIIQGIVGAIGLYLFKVQSPILWGLIMVISAMLPYFGAALVWLPAALFKIFGGDLFNGLGLLLYGLIVISLIDNVVRPALISKRSKIHPVIVILGVFGGIRLFGVVGILVGPMLLAVLIAFLDFYMSEYEA